MRVETTTLHGHAVSYRTAGDADADEVILLLHGIAGSSATWDAVGDALAEHALVIAPDLLGHGASAKPRGDYSLGAFASGARDLLLSLGHDRVTVVGHSLGGGIAMQFAYQFPQLAGRLVLVASGGLGREVSPILRAAAVPLVDVLMPVLWNRRVAEALAWVSDRAARLPFGLAQPGPGQRELARHVASLLDSPARSAFVHTLRTVIDPGGQRVDARDRLYLAEGLPMLLVWGGRDPIIPVQHGLDAHALVEGSRLEVFERAGHFPHVEEPLRFVRVLRDFLATTTPATIGPDEVREMLAAAHG